MGSEKDSAVDFLKMVIAGDIEPAYEKYVTMNGKHHNAYFPAGFASLKAAMIDDHNIHPSKQLIIQQVLGDGDIVAVHSQLVIKPGDPGMTVVHIFRFENGKVVEMWDIGQQLPVESPNIDGAF